MIFHDERRHKKDWLYHGFIVIPQEIFPEVMERLNDFRTSTSYHKKIHFSEMTEEKYSRRILLAKAWINFLKNEFFNFGYFYFFGVDLKNIRYDLFGDTSCERSRKDYRIYNRFFDISLYSMLRYFFNDYDVVNVVNIFSHASNRPEEDPFPRYSIKKLNLRQARNIRISPRTVIQISDDNDKETKYKCEANLIQFADNIIGSVGQVLDCSSKKGCFMELGWLMFPLIEAIANKPYNKRSDYYKRYAINFFPKRLLAEDEMYSRLRSNMFYVKRELKIASEGQLKFPF